MRKAIIKRGITAPYEVVVCVNDVPTASIRCVNYEIDGNMIVCDHGNYNSYAHVDDYICVTWRK